MSRDLQCVVPQAISYHSSPQDPWELSYSLERIPQNLRRHQARDSSASAKVFVKPILYRCRGVHRRKIAGCVVNVGIDSIRNILMLVCPVLLPFQSAPRYVLRVVFFFHCAVYHARIELIDCSLWILITDI